MRRVSSRALRAAWRAREAETAFVMIWRASVGFSSRNSASFALTSARRGRAPTGCRASSSSGPRTAGSRSLTEMTAARPSRTSSPSRLSSFSFSRPLSRAYLLSVPVSAAREARQVRAALVRVDVVREREDRLAYEVFHCIATSTLPCVVLALEVDDVLVDRVLRLVRRRRRSPGCRPRSGTRPSRRPRARRVSRIRSAASGRPSRAGAARASAPRSRSPRRSPSRAGTRSSCRSPSSVADDLHVALRDAARELLAVDLAVAPHLGDEPLGERVHDRDADAVEAAGDLVAVAAELAAGVELRQHDRQRRAAPAPRSRRPGCRGRRRRR